MTIKAVIHTNNWLYNDKFWHVMFGNSWVGRLGLFHLMKQIIDTFDKHCKLYWQGIVSLKTCINQYNPQDKEHLLQAMKNRTWSPSNEKYSDGNIQNLKELKS